MIALHPLTTIGEVRPGDDLAGLLGRAIAAEALLPIAAGDVLVVTQKIVSKAEARFVDLSGIAPGAEARRLAAITRKDPRLIEAALAEADEVVRAAPNVLVTRHRLGLVMANSGIDRSNLGPGDDDVGAGNAAADERALLLPVDPDGTARTLATTLGCAVVISDSFGRPWRHGVTGVAIGAAGLPALVDRRGEPDRDGRRLEVTQVALADMLATAALLATGEGAEGVPAVLIRGMALPPGDLPAAALVRPLAEDLFR